MTKAIARRTALSGAVVFAASIAGIAALPTQVTGSRPLFPVRRYGAVSDGLTDDSEAVRRASAAASAAGGVVLFPKGTTVWNDMSRWYPGVVYRGVALTARVRITIAPNNGPKVTAARVGFERLTFIRADHSSPFVRLQAPDCWIRDCDFIDSGSPKAVAVNIDAPASNARITNNGFHHIRSTSIHIDGASGVRIEGNRIKGQRYETGFSAAIQMTNGTRHTIIRRNVVRISPTSPTPMNGLGLAGTGNSVEHNVFRVSRFAIEAGPGVQGRIANNYCSISSTPVKDGLNYAAGISLPKTTGMEVIDNVVDQQGATRQTWVGIELPESTGCVVRGNTLYGSSHGSQGIILDAANRCSVTENSVVNYPSGITLYGHQGSASRNRVAKNRIVFVGAGPTNAGVSVLLDATGSADHNVITGNRITGVGGGRGISLDRQVGSGSLNSNRIGGNTIADVGQRTYRNGDTRTDTT